MLGGVPAPGAGARRGTVAFGTDRVVRNREHPGSHSSPTDQAGAGGSDSVSSGCPKEARPLAMATRGGPAGKQQSSCASVKAPEREAGRTARRPPAHGVRNLVREWCTAELRRGPFRWVPAGGRRGDRFRSAATCSKLPGRRGVRYGLSDQRMRGGFEESPSGLECEAGANSYAEFLDADEPRTR